MSKILPNWKHLLVAAAIVSLFGTLLTTKGQQPLNGRWTASVDEESGKINLNFERTSEKGGRNQSGQTFSYSELEGLSLEQARAGGPVKFSLVREAGRIDCVGNFQNGKGAGTFVFTGNQSFISNMKSRGFDFESHERSNQDPEERLFVATTVNVTTTLADDLVAAGFKNLDVDDLFKAAIFKVDSKFMREMKVIGFDLELEELVKARIFKVDAAFVAKVRDMGFSNESFESLVKMQIFKVTPEFVAEIRNEGLSDLSIEDLVKLRIFKIDRDFIRQSRADGVPLEVERLVQRRIGVGRN
jgi:hypothetical protein